MLSYSFEDTGGDSLYDYLYKCIKTDILKGNLQADEKLPSKRMLAAHLGVSVITVENAYSQLLAEGYIYSKARSGYYVSPIGLAPKAQMDTAAPAEEDDDQGPAYFADFLASGADADAFPFRIWLKTSQQVMRDKKAELLISKAKGVKSIAAAKAKGAVISNVGQVTFAAPVFVQSTGGSEPALSGAVYATKQGAFSSHPVKGQAGVYQFQVVKKSMNGAKYNEASQEMKLRQKAMQYAGNYMNELYIKAKVVDNRYLFF